MAYINLYVDIDEIINDLSSRELQKLADDLYDDGYAPSQIDEDKEAMLCETNMDIELRNLLFAVWENKNFITQADRDILHTLAKKGSY